MTTGFSIFVALVALLLLAVYRLRVRSRRMRDEFHVDDAAIDRILAHGTLSTADDEPLDESEIARAEREFWEESWEEPDEYGR